MLEFRVLGPLEVCRDGQPIALPGIASRRVLAVLALRAGEWVSVDRLIDEMWSERPPASARKALQMHVSRLRSALSSSGVDGASVLESGPAGYRVAVSLEDIDAKRFEQAVETAQRAIAELRPDCAGASLRDALDLWRGPPLAELSLADGPLASELRRLERLSDLLCVRPWRLC